MAGGCSRYDDTHRGFVAHAQKSAVVLAIVFAIWVMSGFDMVWPVIVMGVVALKLGSHARRVYGSGGGWGDDADADSADDREFTIV